MRTRNQSKRNDEALPAPIVSEEGSSSGAKSKRGKGYLLVKRPRNATCHTIGSAKRRKECDASDNVPEEEHVGSTVEESVRNTEINNSKECLNDLYLKSCNIRSDGGSALVEGANVGDACYDTNELVWEEGRIPVSENIDGYSHDLGRDITVEFTVSPSSSGKKLPGRVSAKDKELAELVHKVHLLCLLARGRIVDNACDDPLIQASLLSLLPVNLLTIGEIQKLTANQLSSLVNWFCDNFRTRSQNVDKGSFKANLAFALQTQEGTAEEVAALSVALFRALNLSARFVSILDVISLKPGADISGVAKKDKESLDIRVSSSLDPCHISTSSDVHSVNKTNAQVDCMPTNSTCNENLNSYGTNLAEVPKRKGDLEFMLELEMAISATSVAVAEKNLHPESDELPDHSSTLISSMKKRGQNAAVDSSVSRHCSSGAIWSRRTGPPLFWAEVYCSGETSSGRWVHVDAANALVDGSEKVEAAAAACRRPLKYVVAFAGKGAKDVTRRYCMHWYKIASSRVNSQWWEAVLGPLKELESVASGSVFQLGQIQGNASSDLDMANNSLEINFRDTTQDISLKPLEREYDTDVLNKKVSMRPKSLNFGASTDCHRNVSRDSLEDMELATRALTEPLPTNQLAYKNHHLYAIEKWLTKNQVLHPKGPILGYCSGHPIYPRSCVKTLQTKQKWLRDGLQVRAGEMPAKVVKCSKKILNDQTFEGDDSIENCGQSFTELFGKWQLEPLKLPHAVNGIVPKNERGQVEVWSEKCLPPGTVHIRLPKVSLVAKRLEIDFAPAMVGFEFRNCRCIPMFDGIVVCTEFKDAILEAYAEEEERRESEERKRNENQALSRWFQLLSSIITRQQLKNSYIGSSSSMHEVASNYQNDSRHASQENASPRNRQPPPEFRDSSGEVPRSAIPLGHEHVHVFPVENQTFDEETLVRTKQCPCGFSIEVEEL